MTKGWMIDEQEFVRMALLRFFDYLEHTGPKPVDQDPK